MIKKKFVFNPLTGKLDTILDPNSILIPDGIPSPWDASEWTLPPTTVWVADRWVISVAGTLPGIGPVIPWGYLIYNGTTWTYISNPASAYVNAWVNNVAVWWLQSNQWPFNTTLQNMFDRILYPFTQQSSVLTISWVQVFEKGVEQAPRTLTGTTTRSTNPTYAITSTVFKRAGTAISTQAGDTTPRTFSETDSILDTTVFSLEVTNSNWYTSTNTKTLTGVYPYFYGKVADVQPIADQALIDSGTKVVASSAGNITIDFNSANNEFCWFAIPESSSAKNTWYVNALNNGTIWQPWDWFPTNVIIPVTSPDGYWTNINYRVYVANYVSAVTDPVTFST